MRAALTVPSGFLVPVDAFRFAEDGVGPPTLAAGLANTLATVERADWVGRIRQRLETSELPPGVARAIRRAYPKLGGGAVAVRSSAIDDDLVAASFAGQQASFLNIVGAAAVLDAVRACWASRYTAIAVDYRRARGFAPPGQAVAGIVQHLVTAARAGVVFTANPVSGDCGELVVNAAFALGEAVVGDRVDPDQWLVDLSTSQVRPVARRWRVSRCWG